MSSPAKDEGSVLEAEADAEGGQWAHILGLLVLETPGNSEDDEGGSPGTEGPKADPEVAGAGGPVLWGRKGHPGTPADVDRRGLYHLGDEATTTILQQLTDRGDLRVRRYPSPESVGSVGPAGLVGQQPGAGGSGVWAGGLARSSLAPATLPRLRAPEVGHAWGSAKRGAGGAKGSSQVAGAGAGQQSSVVDLGYWPSDSQSSDEFPVVPLMKVSIRRRRRRHKRGGLLTPLSPQGAARELSSAVREEIPSVLGSLPPSAPRRPAPGASRPSLRELDMFSRKPSVAQAKIASSTSYLPAAVAVGACPRFLLDWKWPRRTDSQEAPQNLPLQDRRNPYLPVGTKQSKHKGAGQKSLARRKTGSEPTVGEDKDRKRDTGPKGPPLIHRPGPSCPFGHRRECDSGDIGDINIRASQLPGHSQPLAMSQGEVLPRVPAPDSQPVPSPELHELWGTTVVDGLPPGNHNWEVTRTYLKVPQLQKFGNNHLKQRLVLGGPLGSLSELGPLSHPSLGRPVHPALPSGLLGLLNGFPPAAFPVPVLWQVFQSTAAPVVSRSQAQPSLLAPHLPLMSLCTWTAPPGTCGSPSTPP
ncbi:uncharacterized protein CXorf49 homolog [Saccopteryx bilineata]|uniref:uncharacterized protein CXorf49 homolog n=1 Tax=Saccopteryx bilineata TaxID=59482 RepID=UPI00338EC70D